MTDTTGPSRLRELAESNPGVLAVYLKGRIEALASEWEADCRRIETLEADVEDLRKLLWLRDGTAMKYGDDGEMSSEQYGIRVDYKRMSVANIASNLSLRGLADLASVANIAGNLSLRGLADLARYDAQETNDD